MDRINRISSDPKGYIKQKGEKCKEKCEDMANKEVSISYVAHKAKEKIQNRPDSDKDVRPPDEEKKRPHGEELRLHLDGSHPHEHTEIIGKYEIGKRIGRIQFTKGSGVGTGFRVGSKYVMTAYHVIRDRLERLWEEVYELLTKEERKIIEWTTKKLPVTGSWNISNLISSLDTKRKAKLMELAKNYLTGKYEIKFEFLKEGEGRIAKFKHDIAFVSPEYDVLVLELAEQDSETKSFCLVEDNDCEGKLHVFGHPKGKPLQHDPACTIVNSKEKLSNLKEQGIAFFKEKGKERKDIKASYAPCVISTDNILFHSSSSTSHGASGAPLVIVDIDTPKVCGMLLCGYPSIFYNSSFNGDMERPDLLVESGISMTKVRSLLTESSLPELEQELFYNS